MTLLERLKIETRPAHHRIEAAMDMEHRITSLDAYRRLLARFFGFHSAWETAEGCSAGWERARDGASGTILKALARRLDAVVEWPEDDPHILVRITMPVQEIG